MTAGQQHLAIAGNVFEYQANGRSQHIPLLTRERHGVKRLCLTGSGSGEPHLVAGRGPSQTVSSAPFVSKFPGLPVGIDYHHRAATVTVKWMIQESDCVTLR